MHLIQILMWMGVAVAVYQIGTSDSYRVMVDGEEAYVTSPCRPTQDELKITAEHLL